MFGNKGKEKQTDEDLWETRPVVTYRHVLSNTQTVFNPLRVVGLCDSDAFYAACERIRLGLDVDAPIVVQQWDSLIAVSYPARKFGITRMMNITEAKKRCPELVAVHVATYKEGDSEPAYHDNPDPQTHKVSLDHYRRESNKILQIYQELTPPGGGLEKASIDEAFFDFTLPVRKVMLQRYPELAKVPAEALGGLDTPLPDPSSPSIVSWEGLGNLLPIQPPTISTEVEAEGDTALSSSSRDLAEKCGEEHQEATRDSTPDPLTWPDIALSIGAELMGNIRKVVRERLGYTTSAGIARNKVLAKLVASYKKLDEQTILRNAAIPGYWRPMPFQKIRFLGGKLGDTLFNEFAVTTVGELESVTVDEIQKRFGEESLWVWNILRGIDHTEVTERFDNKSMLSSKNIRPAIYKAVDGLHWIRVLSAELALRLLDARQITPTVWPKTLAVHIRQDSSAPRSKQCPFPFDRNFSAHTISRVGEKLWKEITGGKDVIPKTHNISLGFGGLIATEIGQQGIEDFFLNEPDDGALGGKRKREKSIPGTTGDDDNVMTSFATTSFWCARCSKSIGLSKDVDVNDVESAMVALRLEHDDYHFAKTLARDGDGEEEMTRPKKKKKKQKDGAEPKPKGIAKFFTPPTKGSTSKGKG